MNILNMLGAMRGFVPGLDSLATAFEKTFVVAERLRGGLDRLSQTLGVVQRGFAIVGNGAALVGTVFQNTLGQAAHAVSGFARAGVMASTHGERLGVVFQMLQREVGAIFLPYIEKLIDNLEQLFAWMHNLKGPMQDKLLRWAEMGVAILGVSLLLPKVFAGIQLLIGGVRGLAVAFTSLGAAAGGILNLFGMLATLLASLFVANKVEQGGLGGLWENAKGPLGKFLEMAKQVGTWLQNVLGPVAERAGAMVGDAFSKMADWFSANADRLEQVLGPAVERVFALLVRFAEVVYQAASALVTALIPDIESGASAFQGMISVAETLVDIIKALVATFEFLANAVRVALGEMERFFNYAQSQGSKKSLLQRFTEGAIETMPVIGPTFAAIRRQRELQALLNPEGAAGAAGAAGVGGRDNGRGFANVGGDWGPDKPRRDLVPRGGQFEAVQESFRRVMQAALKMETGQNDPAQQQLEVQRQQLVQLGIIAGGIARMKPLLANVNP